MCCSHTELVSKHEAELEHLHAKEAYYEKMSQALNAHRAAEFQEKEIFGKSHI
jgi:hypothetical protein